MSKKRDPRPAAPAPAGPPVPSPPAPVEVPAPEGPAVIRPAQEADLPALVAFEIAIARISFPRDAVTDPAVHEKKLRKALERGEPGMFVLVRAGQVLGWLWATFNTNFLTNEHYATFRSLAVDDAAPDHAALAEALFNYGIGYAQEAGMLEITGKVHVHNTPMRLLYKKAGFEAEHLTMKLPLTNA
ncbi:MAG TPA: GNAT family N-acetyltransferase [Chloroflexia bacterium]|nr:GNAT family N-acetyltransferase [Chloroflexia bacterium]